MSAEEIDAEIDAAIKAYPTRRELPGGGTTGVYIGEDAKALARAYLAANPHYPLKLAAQYTAKTDKRPRNWATWIANPPATSVVLTAYEATLKERAERRAASEAFEPADPTALRAKVREITDHAKKEAAHA